MTSYWLLYNELGHLVTLYNSYCSDTDASDVWVEALLRVLITLQSWSAAVLSNDGIAQMSMSPSWPHAWATGQRQPSESVYLLHVATCGHVWLWSARHVDHDQWLFLPTKAPLALPLHLPWLVTALHPWNVSLAVCWVHTYVCMYVCMYRMYNHGLGCREDGHFHKCMGCLRTSKGQWESWMPSPSVVRVGVHVN